MLEAQAGLTKVKIDGKNPAEWYMDTAKAAGLKVLRTFASGTTPEFPLQITPGQLHGRLSRTAGDAHVYSKRDYCASPHAVL